MFPDNSNMSDLLFNHNNISSGDDSSISMNSNKYDGDLDAGTATIDDQDLDHMDQLMNPTPEDEYFDNNNNGCNYCGVDSPDTLVKCNTCEKWFCNSKSGGSSSHIITHLILSRHHSVALHPESDLGDTTLECYKCGKKNIFNLGFVTAKHDQVVVILCRLPCAQLKDNDWDGNNWKPLVDERQFVSWIATIPTEDELVASKIISYQQIKDLESKWRQQTRSSNDNQSDQGDDQSQQEVLPILMRYNDAYQYQRSFAPLIKFEGDHDRALKESQALERIQVRWSLGLNNRHLASFALSTYENGQLKLAVGDEIILRLNESSTDSPTWEGNGYLIRLPGAYQEEFTIELSSKKTPPIDKTVGFTAEFVWKRTSYDRMQDALKEFAVNEESVSSYIYHKILGHDVMPIEFDVKLPKNLSHPRLTELNGSQLNAVKSVLKRPLSLIQGPPGTGKTVTSATIIYHLTKLNKGQKILVCAPSNVAVDHLASKLDLVGLKVTRLTARSREDVESTVTHLALHEKVLAVAKGPLKKLIKLKNEVGELSESDSNLYNKLIREQLINILDKSDVICCTCIGAGDSRLKKYSFRTVLIDESTQAAEPEILIPMVKGSRQVILVGDHQQLGPVILDKSAGDAGLRQSLFERLIYLGHVPIRLEVQYRMNPYLSEFPSNMFYEGSLQNGISTEDREFNTTLPWPVKDIPMFFWGNFGKEELSSNGSSYLNRVEAMNVEKVVSRLFIDGVAPEDIGVITPYEGQRAFIIQYMMLNSTLWDRKEDYLKIEVTSVDAFQGREKNFIILSCVRANETHSIGFLKDPRRLNVALTRGKYGMVILGNTVALSKNILWNHLLLHYRERGCLVEGPLDNLQLSMLQLTAPKRRIPRFNGANGGGVASTITNNRNLSIDGVSGIDSGTNNESVHNGYDNWPKLNDAKARAMNGNFYSKLDQINKDYEKSKPQINDDDIKSITSSFAAGFNLN